MAERRHNLVTVDNVLAAILGAALAWVVATLYWTGGLVGGGDEASNSERRPSESEPVTRTRKTEKSGTGREPGTRESGQSEESAESSTRDSPRDPSPPPTRRPGTRDRRGDLPDTPSRQQVKSTIGKYDAEFEKCGRRADVGTSEGSVFVEFGILPSGGVVRAELATESFRGTEVGRCVVEVVRRMQFPESKEGTKVKYPFQVTP